MPATPVLARPTSVTGLILSTGTVGTAGADFYIKIVSAKHSHRTMMSDVSGDGDSAPHFHANYWLYVDWYIRGQMIASQLAGMAKMILIANNPTTDTNNSGVPVLFNLSSGNTISGRFLIGAIETEYVRTADHVGISMHLRNTNDSQGASSYVEA